MKLTGEPSLYEFNVRVNSDGLTCPYPSLGTLLGIFFKQAALIGRAIPVPPGLQGSYRTFDRVDVVVSSFEDATIPADYGEVRMVVADCRFVKGRSMVDRADVYAAYDSASTRVMKVSGSNLDLVAKLAKQWNPSLEWYNPEDDLDVD